METSSLQESVQQFSLGAFFTDHIMRLEIVNKLFDLAREVAATRQGMTLTEMATRLQVGRRTAERYRDALDAMFTLDGTLQEDGQKRWRMTASSIPYDVLTKITANELAELAAAEREQRLHGMAARADNLRSLQQKLQTSIKRPVNTDVEALMEAEGLAMRPGPRPKVNAETLETLRHAIKACQVLGFDYRARGGRAARHEGWQPHGVLFGAEAYLVAMKPGKDDPALFRLGAMKNIVLGGFFTRLEGFDIHAFAARSFGVFQDTPLEVRLRFSAELAGKVREFAFHPTQVLEELPEGEIRVTFTAASEVEICHHLFTWGPDVSIEGPATLKRRYRAMLRACLG